MADRPKDPRRIALNKVMAALDILPENERDRVLDAVNTLYGYTGKPEPTPGFIESGGVLFRQRKQEATALDPRD